MTKVGVKVRNKELNCAVQRAIRQGIKIKRTANSHLVVVPSDKELPLFHLPSTPSDYRAVKNAISMLKKAGYQP